MSDCPVPFADYQTQLYAGGLGGAKPAHPIDYAQLEQRARDVLDPVAYAYVAGGAGSEDTMRANLEAFRRWRIVPRMLRDVSQRDVSLTLFGAELPAPVLLAPIGVQGIVHPDGEVAAARAAAEVGLPVVLSTASSRTMEEVADAMGAAPRWYQLYWPNDPELAASFIERAERAGYGALVVTLDTRMLAWRPRDLQSAYLPFLRGEGIANYLADPVFRKALPAPPEEDLNAAVGRWAEVFPHPSSTWEDLGFIRERTRLPILLKGVLHPDDARLAVEHGVDGLVVSNHGGRQVDGSISTLDALPGVVDAVPDGFPVLLDSGIRTGADVVKAVALGARAVLVGRPYVWALAIGGERGVVALLRGLLAELDLTVALSGHKNLDELDPDLLVRLSD